MKLQKAGRGPVLSIAIGLLMGKALMANAASGVGADALRIQDDYLLVQLNPEAALLRVEDRRSGRVYQQFYPERGQTFRVVSQSAASGIS